MVILKLTGKEFTNPNYILTISTFRHFYFLLFTFNLKILVLLYAEEYQYSKQKSSF